MAAALSCNPIFCICCLKKCNTSYKAKPPNLGRTSFLDFRITNAIGTQLHIMRSSFVKVCENTKEIVIGILIERFIAMKLFYYHLAHFQYYPQVFS